LIDNPKSLTFVEEFLLHTETETVDTFCNSKSLLVKSHLRNPPQSQKLKMDDTALGIAE